MITTQNKEFEDQIDHIGELYEQIKVRMEAIELQCNAPSDITKVYQELSELRDIACMAVKHIHQPIDQSKLEE